MTYLDDVIHECEDQLTLNLCNAARDELAALRSRLAALESENSDESDSDRLREKLASLLRRTADALKGEPEPLHLHDWSDMPDVAARLRARLAAAEALLLECRNHVYRHHENRKFDTHVCEPRICGTVALLSKLDAALADQGSDHVPS